MTRPGKEASKSAVVLAVDRNYVIPVTVVLRSIAEHSAGASPPVRILGYEFAAEDIGHLLDEAGRLGIEMEFKPVGVDLGQLDVQLHLTPAAWVRVLIPDLCPDLDVALYLDADLIVLHDLGPLLAQQLGDMPVAAVRDYGVPELGTPHLGPPPFDFSVLDPRIKYFNSGMMVMNLPAWREVGLTARILEFARANGRQLRFADQDALNGVIAGQWIELDPRWNVIPLTDIMKVIPFTFLGEPYLRLEDMPALEAQARILHFASPLKPWQARYPHGRNRARYQRYTRLVHVVASD